MAMPYFSRAQQAVILLLGASLLFLWAWRANFFLAPSPPPAKTMDLVFVEVSGAVAHPGVYSFPQPPTLLEALEKAGGPRLTVPANPTVPSGTRIEVGQEGLPRLSRMAGETLLTLGLPLDLNTAIAQDLDALPDIGPVLAERIIAYRQAHGPFKKIDDLMEVSGIGPQKLAKLKPYLVLGDQEATTTHRQEGIVSEKPSPGTGEKTSILGPVQPGGRRAAKKPPDRAIDPNRATAEDLDALPGIGPVLAKRIIDYRKSHGPFKKIDDLEQVSGIGPKKLEKLKPFLIINGQEPAAPDH